MFIIKSLHFISVHFWTYLNLVHMLPKWEFKNGTLAFVHCRLKSIDISFCVLRKLAEIFKGYV